MLFRQYGAGDLRYGNDYMMFPFPLKAYWTFFTDVLYYILVVFAVNGVYNLINDYMFSFSIEPMSWSLVVLVIDMALTGIKDLIVHLVKKHKVKEISDVQ